MPRAKQLTLTLAVSYLLIANRSVEAGDPPESSVPCSSIDGGGHGVAIGAHRFRAALAYGKVLPDEILEARPSNTTGVTKTGESSHLITIVGAFEPNDMSIASPNSVLCDATAGTTASESDLLVVSYESDGTTRADCWLDFVVYRPWHNGMHMSAACLRLRKDPE